jgi:hypothetical protein
MTAVATMAAARSTSPAATDAAPPPVPASAPRTRPPNAPPAKSRAPSQEIAAIAEPEPSREITILHETSEAVPVPGPARITDSTQFVMPHPEPAAPQAMPGGPSMISHAVAAATPSPAIGIRTKAGGLPPRPLSELATSDLVRPDDSDDPFEIAANGALVIRVTERVMTRLDGVHITGGDLAYELAMRRSRGHNTEERFDHGGSPVHVVTGRGYLIAVPGKHTFSAVSLDDDILYLREDLVFAFEASLRWENGNVPGLRGRLPVVQFRGDGALALRLVRPLVRVKLPAQGMVFVDATRLAGWIGRVIPRAVVPPSGGPLGTMCIECTGEGVVLVDPAPEGDHAVPEIAPRPPRTRAEGDAAAAAPKRPSEQKLPTRAPGGAASAADPASDPLGRLDEL